MERARPANYNTRQRQQILDYLSSLGDAHVTAGQITRHFAEGAEVIGQTTVYRHLEKLVTLGSIRKYTLNDGESACYQYVTDSACHEHFHLKCEQCGQLIHLDCELLDEIEQHMLSEHKFQINALKTVLYGRCGKCREEGSE